MSSENTKEQLMAATRELLLTSPYPEKITARQIASQANVNLAMINYCFGSKDELLKLTIDGIIAGAFSQYAAQEEEHLSPKEQLKRLLYHVSEVTLQYETITRLSVPYVLLQAPFDMPYQILPYITAHFGGRKTERACQVIALELVSFLQLVLYRAKDFGAYAGVNVREPRELQKLIDDQLDLLLGDEEIEK
ncbi:MAG: TetR/AcrR family transcriptional regulator [Clostridiales bacterium]|nr:TetR/AcrR family transcriptional regulator [Clostridiales bacterium]